MFEPNRQQPGSMQTMNAPAMQTMSALAGTPMPERPTFAMPGISSVGDFRNLPQDQRMAALQGFRDQRADYRDQLWDWRMDMRDWRQQNRGGGKGPREGIPPVAGQQAPAAAPQPVANSFPGMVGQSLYVQGMTPGATPFDLPTY